MSVWAFILVLFITPNSVPLLFGHDKCPSNINANLNWYHQIQTKFNPIKCLQILHSGDAEVDNYWIECVMKHLMPFNYTFYMRSVAETISTGLDNSTNPASVVYKYCKSILITHSNALFRRNASQSLPSQVFYPHSWIMVYDGLSRIGNNKLDDDQLDYIRDNALFVFTVSGNWTNFSISEALSGQSLVVGTTDQSAFDAFVDNLRVHPLFRNEPVVTGGVDRRKPFRISFFECQPYVMLTNGTNQREPERLSSFIH